MNDNTCVCCGEPIPEGMQVFARSAGRRTKMNEENNKVFCIAHYEDELSKYQKEMPKIVEYIDYLRSLPANRWISVKDSVPEAGVNVLVTDGINMMVTWCEYIDNQCLWVDNFYTYVNVRFKEVTHWMPLPEPPKGGDTNG